MCVFGIHVLKIVVERWFWEVYIVFGSLVVLHVWLHSCLCFSLLEKLFLKACSTPGYLSSFQAFFLIAISTPPRHLVDRSESSCLLDSFSTARLIDRAFVLDMVVCSLTHAWHLHLSTAIFSTPTLTDFLTPLDTFICWDLLIAYIFSSCDLHLIFVDLSLDTSVFSSPKPFSLNPNLFPKGFSSLIKFFPHLVCL